MILIICLHLIQIHPLMTFKKLTHKSELSQIHLVPSVFPFRQNNLSVVFYYNFSFSPCTDTANAVKDSNPGSFPVPWRFWFSQQNGHVNLPKAQPAAHAVPQSCSLWMRFPLPFLQGLPRENKRNLTFGFKRLMRSLHHQCCHKFQIKKRHGGFPS